MANTAFERIRTTALALDQSERAELAHELLASLDETIEPTHTAIAGAWDAGRPQRLTQIDKRSRRMFDRVELKWMVRRHLPPK